VRVDVLFPRARLAVFVDGCFWHGCSAHGTRPKSNSGYWLPKLSANAERDIRVNAALRSAGWSVIRIWEHDEPDTSADLIARVLAQQLGT
jgi:DNA mismatch endonuclease (patch repair protein)